MHLTNLIKITKVLNILLVTNKAHLLNHYVLSYLMSFFIKGDEVKEKYKQIWDVIKNKLKIKFHSLPVYDKKYLKTKVREYDGVIKTNFLGNGIPKENMHYTCIACITINSVMEMEKNIFYKFIWKNANIK